MQADNVAFRQQHVKSLVFADFLEHWGWKWVVGNDFTTEPLHNTSSGDANLACSHNAYRLAVERMAQQSAESKVAFSNAVVCTVSVAVQCLNEGHCKFSNGLR
ncbi:hypothetical protein VCV18_000986 [Metarhizium anisopliae]